MSKAALKSSDTRTMGWLVSDSIDLINQVDTIFFFV